jgi:endonuclease/exonuclease/phosphatase family metal-dependent hydrolase
MSDRLRIATWNVDRSGIQKKRRIGPQLTKLTSIDADILVLTETHESVRPKGYDYHVESEPEPGYHQKGESCVAIWSRYPLKPVPTAAENRYFTVCAQIHEPQAVGNIIVYGTIITYGNDGVSEGVKAWQRHRDAVKSQTLEWNRLKRRYPAHLRIVAGDFNENLDGKKWYGVKDAKDAIKAGLSVAGLHCPTAAKSISLVTGESVLSRSTVDHICVSEGDAEVLSVLAWEGKEGTTVLSDHNGILVDIALHV